MANTKNMQAVKQAFINAGFSENQANQLAAEVGRENGFQDKYLFGTHSDPKNQATNLGFFSWQGPRGQKLAQQLQAMGLMKNGQIERSQRSLDAMARFARQEIETNPAYAETREKFLNNPDVPYDVGNRVLGNNYIRWRYDDSKYNSGHEQRNKYYAQLGGIVPKDYMKTWDFQPNVGYTGGPMEYNIPSLDKFNGYVDNLSQMFGGQANVLGGPLGLNVPQTLSQNDTYGRIADMGLDDPNEEAAYAEAGRALADARDSMGAQESLIRPISPIRTDLEYIFDNIDPESTA